MHPSRTNRIRGVVAGILILALLVTGVACAGSTQTEDDRPLVVASFYPIYDFASRVAGDRARVVNLIPSAGDPHSWEPTAADMVLLEKASVFAYNGVGLESWVDLILPALENDSLVVAETSSDLNLIHSDEEEEHGDTHDAGTDPHVWLSPSNAKKQMERILEALIQADPDGEAEYTENFNRNAEQFDVLDATYRSALEPYAGASLIVSHAAFAYLCRDFDLVQVPVEGLTPDGEPEPARIADIIRLAEEQQITAIFFERTASSRVADVIADEIGATASVLRTVAALSAEEQTEGADYISVMTENLNALVSAFAAEEGTT